MRHPWKRQLEQFDKKVEESRARRRAVEQLAEQARKASTSLSRKVDKNGFTDLLQQAMGGR